MNSQKTNQFNLSEKRHAGSMLAQYDEYFYKKDVKEFIRLLKGSFEDEEIDYSNKSIIERIEALAGEKLI